MKFFIALLLGILECSCVFAQQYRLVYDESSLPELYDHIAIYAQQQKGNSYINLPQNKYKLSTNDGSLRNNVLIIDRNKLQQNKGIVNFTLSVQDQSIPIQLQLPTLKSIRYNLYTDSIKPILNYYVNIEGEFTSGRILPLDSNMILIKADQGSMKGMEWIVPAERNFDKVTFIAIVKAIPGMSASKTVYIKQFKDPRDASDYQGPTEEEIIKQKKRR